MNNVEMKIEWGEIAAVCVSHENEIGYLRAMVIYDSYDARYWAERQAKMLDESPMIVHSKEFRTKANEWQQNAYRAMVKANIRKNAI